MNPLRSVGRYAGAAGLLVFLGFTGPASSGEFHTSPACWAGPRLYHDGPPPAELANRTDLQEIVATGEMPGEPTVSPNGAYSFWVRNPDTASQSNRGAALTVDAERAQRRTVLLIQDPAGPLEPRWVNEKLIFLRIPWGRRSFSDLILDVEGDRVIFHEMVRDGTEAYEQFQQSCDGQCPCEAAGAVAVPAARPAPDALIGLLQLPTVFGTPEQGGVRAAQNPQAVALFAEPAAGAEPLAKLSAIEDFESREYTYERAAAVVHEERSGWYRIGLRTRRLGRLDSAWIAAGDAGEFLPIGPLLVDRLAYLNDHWDGRLWPWPVGRSQPRATRVQLRTPTGSNQVYPVRVLQSRMLNGGLWLRVETLSGDPCGGRPPDILDRGWVPAYSERGQLVAGFHSRGC